MSIESTLDSKYFEDLLGCTEVNLILDVIDIRRKTIGRLSEFNLHAKTMKIIMRHRVFIRSPYSINIKCSFFNILLFGTKFKWVPEDLFYIPVTLELYFELMVQK